MRITSTPTLPAGRLRRVGHAHDDSVTPSLRRDESGGQSRMRLDGVAGWRGGGHRESPCVRRLSDAAELTRLDQVEEGVPDYRATVCDDARAEWLILAVARGSEA